MNLGDFDAKLDEAKAKIRSLGDTVHIKMDVDNGALRQIAQDTEAIHRMMGQNQAIRERVNLDDADAKTRLAALTRDRSVRVRVDVDKSKLSEAESLFSKIGGALGGGHSFNLPFTNMTANPIGLAAILSGIAALLPELAGLVSGFAAAGAGAGAFAALAIPSIRGVTTAVSNLKTAQANFGKADLLEKVAPSAAHLKALGEARDKLHAAQQAIKDLGPGATTAASGLQTLSQRFHDLASAFKPQALKIFNDVLKIANDLLPTLGPMATAFANALDPLLKRLDKFVQSKDFKKWMDDFTSRIGPAVTAIGNGLAKAGPAIGRFLTALSSPGAVNAINIAFSVLTGTLDTLTATVRFLANAWSGMMLFGHNVASTFDSVRHSIATFGHDVASNFDTIRHTIASFNPAAIIGKLSGLGHSIASAFDGVRHDIAAKFDGVRGAVAAKFAGAGAWLADKAHAIANAFDHVRHDIAAWFDGVKNAVVAKFAGAASWLVSTGSNIIQGLINGLLSKIPGLQSVVNTVVGILKSVGHAVGVRSPSTLFDYYGRMIGLGLAQGIQSQQSRVQLAANGLVGVVTSPAAAAAGAHALGGGEFVNHVHVHLDGREIYSSIQKQAVSTQRRTGQTGLTKRTR